MDRDDHEVLSLRRQRTLEVKDNKNGIHRRHSSRVNAVSSVREITKSLSKSKRSITSSQSRNLNDVSQNARTSVSKEVCYQKLTLATQNKKSSSLSLSKKKSGSEKNDPPPELTNKRFSLKQHSKSVSISSKDLLISRLSGKSSQQTDKNGVELWYRRGSFVATRAPDEDNADYYICVVLRDIYNFTKKAKVRWLDRHCYQKSPCRYKMKYLDWIDPACILLEVKTNQLSRLFYDLPLDEHDEIMKVLEMVQDFESGKLSISDISDDVHEVVQVDEPPKKKPKLVKSVSKKDGAPKSPRKKVKLVKSASKKITEKAKKNAQKKEKPEKKSRKKKDGTEKAEPKRKKATPADELKLVPRPDVKVLDEDPLFESRTPMPYVSKRANAKLIFRAIALEDKKLLKKLLRDKERIYLLYDKSVDNDLSPVEATVKANNLILFNLFLHEFCGNKFAERRVNNFDDRVSLDKLDTGHYNPKSLGVSRIFKIQASRGCKEGNNAFLTSEGRCSLSNAEDFLGCALIPHGAPDHFIEELLKFKKQTEEQFYNSMYGGHFFIDVLLMGHYKIAGKIVKYSNGWFFRKAFNQLIKEVLTFETEELTSCPPSAVKFSSKKLDKLTPVHYAAVNPNSKYLEKLLSVEPLAHVSDTKGRRPIHFAACCSSSDNLELLFKWGANLNETCQSHQLPLHYAINAKRPQNVKMLLETASKSTSSDVSMTKFGVGGINFPFRNGMSPLHRAIELEEKEIVELLLSYGAPVNAKSSVTSMQVTALMAAAATGNLDIVKLLVKHGAVVEQKDRLGRTALIHACRNGATKVLSYLIHIGSNPERPDSSENYPIHYAAAYGWLFTVRFLIEVGVDINVLNMWKFSPVSVAFVKGHVGIVRELLMNEKVDINQTMEDGTSLLFQACESDLCQEDLYEQIEYLVKEKGAVCDIRDVNGKTALFYLANSKIEDQEKLTQAHKQSIKIADLLIDHGCDCSAVDDNGFTAAMEALRSMANLPLAEALIKKGCKVLGPSKPGPEEEPQDSLLHAVVKNFYRNEDKALKVLQLLKKHNFESEAKKMASHVDSEGYTPFLWACKQRQRVSLHSERLTTSISEEYGKCWDDVLDFFKYLMTTFQADVNAKVAEKFMTEEEKLAVTRSCQKYTYVQDGGRTALHLLLNDDPQFHLVRTKSATRASIIICHLLEKGANIDYRDIQGMTPLGTAGRRGYVSTVDYLVKNTKCDINLPIKIDIGNGKQIEEHLHNSVVECVVDFNAMFSTLIDGGIDVNARSQKDKNHDGTFLHLLLEKQDLDRSELGKIVDKLSQTSFDFDAQDNKGRTVLHYALRSSKSQLNDSLELESKLLSKCSLTIKDKRQRTPLHYVFKKKTVRSYYWSQPANSNPSQLLRLVCQKAEKSTINHQDRDGKTILHMAAELGHFVCVFLLTKHMDSVKISLKDNDGNTPLSLAVKNGHESCALALIQCGASLKDQVVTVSAEELKRRKEERKRNIENNKEDDEGCETDEEENDTAEEEQGWQLTALGTVKKSETVSRAHMYKAALDKQLAGTILQILDAPKDKTNLTHKDMIMMAMENSKYNIALQIMHTSCGDPKSSSLLRSSYEMGRNLLHLLPLSSEDRPREDYSSFLEVAKLLMSIGISSNSVDNYGCTPIQYAMLNRHLELATLLAENGSGYDVNKKDKFGRGYLAALMWRVHSKGIDGPTWNFLEKLITEKKLNIDVMFDLPLSPDTLEMKARLKGLNIQKDPDYWQRYPEAKTTALIAAINCTDFSSNICHNLLKYGANPNTPDGNNVSPLMHAVMRNKTSFVRQLFDHDYDPNAKEEPDNKKATNEKKKHKLNIGIFRLVANAAVESDESSEESDMEDDTADQAKKEKEKKDESSVKEFKSVKKTSSVKVDQKDNDGRTALHYVACPSPLGTFDNAELAFVLIKGGSKSMTDKFGFTPYTLAVETCATSVIDQLRLLGHGTNRSIKIQYKDNLPVDDGINFSGKQDFMRDAEKVLQRHDSGMDVDDVYVHEVDENCNVTNGELMKDKEMDIWYDILMTKVDVKRLDRGLYNFYKLQLVYQPDKKLYILFTRWGRIGETGQFQHTPFHEEAVAIKEFAKVFRAKSGNKWIDIKKYERKPRKYRLLEDVARKAPPEQKDVKLDLKSNALSALPKHLYMLVHRLMSPKIMEVSMKKSRCVNAASLPFGQLNKERLMQGKQLLERIEKYIVEVEEYKRSLRRAALDKEKMEVIEKNCEQICEMSNDYFHVIPQQNFSCEKCQPLNAQSIIEHLHFISNMLNYELVSKMLLAAMTHKAKTNPVDFVYRCLGCKIELMQEDDPMSQLILRYVLLTSNSTVLRIYKLSREGEEERLKATQLGNHRLLWHGTQSTNLLSILSRGMLVSPPDATCTAWAYGKGVYFADEFSKSANYVRSSAGKRSFMLLCQVALGNCVPYQRPDALSTDKPSNEKPKNSTVVERDSSLKYDWLVLNTGAKIPYSKQDSFDNNFSREYIVENPAQICLRYLIEYV